ncbi:MAG: thiamine biosynthesis protein [Polyangiaceae bacterium]
MAALLLAVASGCRSEPVKTTAVPDAGVPASVDAAPPAASSRTADPRWQRAMGDDPLDIERLAAAVGAAELLAGVGEGGEVARVALLALAHADDADLAMGALCDRAAIPPPDPPRAAVLASILGIAGRPSTQREPQDPDGIRRCGELLPKLGSDTALPATERALALSAARALGLKGQLDPSKAPPAGAK